MYKLHPYYIYTPPLFCAFLVRSAETKSEAFTSEWEYTFSTCKASFDCPLTEEHSAVKWAEVRKCCTKDCDIGTVVLQTKHLQKSWDFNVFEIASKMKTIVTKFCMLLLVCVVLYSEVSHHLEKTTWAPRCQWNREPVGTESAMYRCQRFRLSHKFQPQPRC